MSDEALSADALRALIAPLEGLPVSLPWKGYGSAVFLEVGALAPLSSKRQHHNSGEACIAVEWDWRVESGPVVLYGSSDSGPAIEVGLKTLQGLVVTSLTIEGRVPEIVVQFSNSHVFRSMLMTAGTPQWSIKALDGRHIYARDGTIQVGDGTTIATEEESAVIAHAECTAERWGTPVALPTLGACRNCKFYLRIDGSFELLDYGVCSSESSPLDGKVVNFDSGCPAFVKEHDA